MKLIIGLHPTLQIFIFRYVVPFGTLVNTLLPTPVFQVLNIFFISILDLDFHI